MATCVRDDGFDPVDFVLTHHKFLPMIAEYVVSYKAPVYIDYTFAEMGSTQNLINAVVAKDRLSFRLTCRGFNEVGQVLGLSVEKHNIAFMLENLVMADANPCASPRNVYNRLDIRGTSNPFDSNDDFPMVRSDQVEEIAVSCLKQYECVVVFSYGTTRPKKGVDLVHETVEERKREVERNKLAMTRFTRGGLVIHDDVSEDDDLFEKFGPPKTVRQTDSPNSKSMRSRWESPIPEGEDASPYSNPIDTKSPQSDEDALYTFKAYLKHREKDEEKHRFAKKHLIKSVPEDKGTTPDDESFEDFYHKEEREPSDFDEDAQDDDDFPPFVDREGIDHLETTIGDDDRNYDDGYESPKSSRSTNTNGRLRNLIDELNDGPETTEQATENATAYLKTQFEQASRFEDELETTFAMTPGRIITTVPKRIQVLNVHATNAFSRFAIEKYPRRLRALFLQDVTRDSIDVLETDWPPCLEALSLDFRALDDAASDYATIALPKTLTRLDLLSDNIKGRRSIHERLERPEDDNGGPKMKIPDHVKHLVVDVQLIAKVELNEGLERLTFAFGYRYPNQGYFGVNSIALYIKSFPSTLAVIEAIHREQLYWPRAYRDSRGSACHVTLETDESGILETVRTLSNVEIAVRVVNETVPYMPNLRTAIVSCNDTRQMSSLANAFVTTNTVRHDRDRRRKKPVDTIDFRSATPNLKAIYIDLRRFEGAMIDLPEGLNMLSCVSDDSSGLDFAISQFPKSLKILEILCNGCFLTLPPGLESLSLITKLTTGDFSIYKSMVFLNLFYMSTHQRYSLQGLPPNIENLHLIGHIDVLCDIPSSIRQIQFSNDVRGVFAKLNKKDHPNLKLVAGPESFRVSFCEFVPNNVRGVIAEFKEPVNRFVWRSKLRKFDPRNPEPIRFTKNYLL